MTSVQGNSVPGNEPTQPPVSEAGLGHDASAAADLSAQLPDRVTYRSYPALIVGGLLSAALLGGSIAMWVAMGAEARAQWTMPQLLTILFFLFILIGVVMSVGFSKVTAGPAGVTVRNAVRTHRYGWDEVEDFFMAPGDPWAYMKFPDRDGEEGDSRLVLAVQRAEGDNAEEHLEVLRALVRKYHHAA